MTGTVRAPGGMAPAREVAGRRIRRCGREALLVLVLAVVLSGAAAAEQASQPEAPAAGQLDVSGGGDSGGDSSGYACARFGDGTARCWGFGGTGQLGYGATATIGDDETPGSTGPVDLGAGRTVKAISAGAFHTCALLDDGTVRCWGFGGDGRLGYANTNAVGDDESPGSVGPIDLGVERTAVAISAGGAHTCAVLDTGSVRCWGFGSDGRLGYGNRASIGDDETPAAVAPVDLEPGRTAKAISAGRSDTCALLDNGAVSCWGLGANGQLGYGNDVRAVGDDETPASVGVVDLGAGRTAKAISAGGGHTCALLDDGAVRCWGFGGNGRLGYANTNTVGDDETPGSVGPVDLGPGRTAKAISAGGNHTCALLDGGTVRCWGFGRDGRLGYANTNDIGDDETPGSVGSVDLGPGDPAAISAGGDSTCARLSDGDVRCWGDGTYGRLGYCNTDTIGDDETPGAAGPVELGPPGGAGTQCAVPPPASAPPPAPAGPSPLPAGRALPPPADRTVAALAAQTRRFAALRSCLQAASRRVPSRRSPARRRCRLLHGRTPGQVATLAGKAAGRTTIRLTFRAVGTDDAKPPAARNYLIKQSRRPIRTPLEVRRANALCDGNCRFSVTAVGAKINLTITQLRRHTTYYYVVVARDNVTARPGPRSRSIRARTP